MKRWAASLVIRENQSNNHSVLSSLNIFLFASYATLFRSFPSLLPQHNPVVNLTFIMPADVFVLLLYMYVSINKIVLYVFRLFITGSTVLLILHCFSH